MSLPTKAQAVVQFTREQDGQPALTSERYTKVHVAEFGAGATSTTLKVSASDTISTGITVLSTTAAGTKSAVAAMANTAIQVRGFSLCNEGANGRRFELRFGTTAFWKGYVHARLPFNWNYIGGYPLSADNKKVVAYTPGAGTASITINYKKV
jgi:hypothetical protein